jgi:hypothetical protein
MKKYKILLIIALLNATFINAQDSITFELKSFKNAQSDNTKFNFEDWATIEVSIKIDSIIDSPNKSYHKASKYLNNCFPLINNFPYEKWKLVNLKLISFRSETCKIKSSEGRGCITYNKKYLFQLSSKYENEVLSPLWNNNYSPKSNSESLKFTLTSNELENNKFEEKDFKLVFYNQKYLTIFGWVFIVVLVLILFFSIKDKFKVFRDEDVIGVEPEKAPFSLSKFQTFLWTFIILAAVAFLWTVTDLFPILGGSHFVLLGIAAGQRLIAKSIDQSNPYQPVVAAESNNTKQSSGFITDILSDSKGISATRIQYLLTTVILITVFIHAAIHDLKLHDFTPMQLALMGVSAGIYLWNKQLDQQKIPFDLKIKIEADNLDPKALAVFNSQPPGTIDLTIDNKLMYAERVSDFIFNVRNVISGSRIISITYKLNLPENNLTTFKGNLTQNIDSNSIVVIKVKNE